MYYDTIDEIVIGLTLCAVYSLITTVNTVEKCAHLPAHIMKTTLLLPTPTPTQQDISKMAVYRNLSAQWIFFSSLSSCHLLKPQTGLEFKMMWTPFTTQELLV